MPPKLAVFVEGPKKKKCLQGKFAGGVVPRWFICNWVVATQICLEFSPRTLGKMNKS